MSQIPELRQQLAENEQAFIERVQAHPHDFGNAPTTSSSQRKQHFTGVSKQRPGSRSNGKTNPAINNPPIDHLHTERAREEEQMSRSARWNSEHNRTQSQQSRPSKGGFWGLVDSAANSQLVTSINRAGDAVAHTVADMLDPVKQFKTAMTHSGEAIESFRSGQIIRGAGYTAATIIDVAGFLPLEKFAVSTVQFTTRTVNAAGSRIGFFGGRSSAQMTLSNTNNVSFRVTRMMEKNTGYNVSPETWFKDFKSIGQNGTYVTDYRSIGEIIGPVRANVKIDVGFFSIGNQLSRYKVLKLEKAIGLRPRTLTDGFRFTRISHLDELHLRSPLGGNHLFLESGKGLPGGGPELLIDSIPTSPWP